MNWNHGHEARAARLVAGGSCGGPVSFPKPVSVPQNGNGRAGDGSDDINIRNKLIKSFNNWNSSYSIWINKKRKQENDNNSNGNDNKPNANDNNKKNWRNGKRACYNSNSSNNNNSNNHKLHHKTCKPRRW